MGHSVPVLDSHTWLVATAQDPERFHPQSCAERARIPISRSKPHLWQAGQGCSPRKPSLLPPSHCPLTGWVPRVLRAPRAPTLCHRAWNSWEIPASPPFHTNSQHPAPGQSTAGPIYCSGAGWRAGAFRGPGSERHRRLAGSPAWSGTTASTSASVDTAGGFLWAALQGWEGHPYCTH